MNKTEEARTGLPWQIRRQRICLQYRTPRFNAWVGKILWMRAWQLTSVFLPGESPWTEESGGLQSIGLQRVGHNWATKLSTSLVKKLSPRKMLLFIPNSSILPAIFPYDFFPCLYGLNFIISFLLFNYLPLTCPSLYFFSLHILAFTTCFPYNHWWINKVLIFGTHIFQFFLIFYLQNTSASSLIESMDGVNDSVVFEFVLIGLSNSWKMHLFLFWFFFVFYLGIILGNLFIVFTVIIDSHLHSPMYFLLANLSLLDLGLSSTTVPKMISDLYTNCKIISFPKCMTQIFFIHVMGGVEMMLLIAMAFDRYTAICKPLDYLTIMSSKMCVSFVVVAWIVGIIHAVSQFVFVINLPFCGPNKVDSFYCDFPQVMKLACVDTYKLEFAIIANSGFISMATFFSLIIILHFHFGHCLETFFRRLI